MTTAKEFDDYQRRVDLEQMKVNALAAHNAAAVGGSQTVARGHLGQYHVMEISNGYIVHSQGDQHYCENLQAVGEMITALLVTVKARRTSE